MVGVNVRGGAECEHSCVSLTHAGVKICGKTARAIVKFGRSFRRSGATLRRAEHLLRRLSNAFVSSAGRWSRFEVRGSQSAVSSLGRHTIVARNVCCVDVRAIWRVFRVIMIGVNVRGGAEYELCRRTLVLA